MLAAKAVSTSSKEKVEVLSSSSYIDSLGCLHIIGEVVFNGSNELSPYRAVSVLSHNGYYDSVGFYHIVGEVKKGNFEVANVKVISTLYNSKGEVIGVGSTYVKFDTLVPGETSPFEILVTHTSGKIHHYALVTQAKCEILK